MNLTVSKSDSQNFAETHQCTNAFFSPVQPENNNVSDQRKLHEVETRISLKMEAICK